VNDRLVIVEVRPGMVGDLLVTLLRDLVEQTHGAATSGGGCLT
jgi:hypothetical protein